MGSQQSEQWHLSRSQGWLGNRRQFEAFALDLVTRGSANTVGRWLRGASLVGRRGLTVVALVSLALSLMARLCCVSHRLLVRRAAPGNACVAWLRLATGE